MRESENLQFHNRLSFGDHFMNNNVKINFKSDVLIQKKSIILEKWSEGK